ncbi:uncharacterized protein LOC128234745 isoform X2 [Mya arenaria]|uniref:uncharacterized protein LOC128234745 isoform X2 n=1 Tax=Mya arenaria TaxID=6604 RepID=UPI0022E1FCC7|nr:uncharacterized protein LOC128234745 isoform X2 [Mya arenaria]
MSVPHSQHTTPRTSASHGRIVTQNSALSASLRDRSSHPVEPEQSPRSLSVSSPSALDVVSTHTIVSNASPNASTDFQKESRVENNSRIKSDLNFDTNREKDSEIKLDKGSSDGVHFDSASITQEHTQDHIDTTQDSRLDLQETVETPRSNRFDYHSLKSRGDSVNRESSTYSQKKSVSSDDKQPHTTLDVKETSCIVITDTEGVNDSDTNNYEHKRLKSRNADKTDRKTITSHALNENSVTRYLHAKTNTREFAQQNTGLSLHSQKTNVKHPDSVDKDEQLKRIPPLDLSNVSPAPYSDTDLDSPIFPQQSDLPQAGQDLHVPDRQNSLTPFSSHDVTATGRKTYEVESPVLSKNKPHIVSSNNFRRDSVQDFGDDTYRERQASPEKVEARRSDLADNLNVPYPFDTQAQAGQTNRSDLPPSPPVQTTPPPNKKPATSLHSNSQVYAVTNPEIQRAQGERVHTGNSNHRSEVRFSGGQERGVPDSERELVESRLRDRAPTPYAKSPQREELPQTPPDWDPPRESRELSAASKNSRGRLPPQHPPLDTLHTPKPDSRERADNQSIKRVYVESPSFTREEEEEYRFVSSRLDDIDDKGKTFREMDSQRRGYGGDDNHTNGYADARSRKTESDYDRRRTDNNRYEDRMDDKYAERNKTRSIKDDRERYEDRSNEMNGYGDYRDRDRNPHYDTGSQYKASDREDRYDRLRNEREEYDREPRREDESNIRYKKENTATDDQDLRLEEEYQKDLKSRIDKNKVKDIEQPRYARRDSYEKENEFPRDSLEYTDDRNNARGGYARDSLDYNHYEQQQDWENPPPNPYQESGSYSLALVKQDSKPDFYDPEDVERMDIVNPKAPKYDYIEGNKYDYGKPPEKSYREIVHKKKEEEEKLDQIFITPKVPSKPKRKAPAKKSQSAQPQHMGYQPPEQYPMGFKPSSAEELWANRAANLSRKKDSAQSKKGSAGKPVQRRWNTNPQVKQAFKFEAPAPLPNQGQGYKPPVYRPNQSAEQSGYSQARGGYGTPTRQLQPLDNKPAPPVSTEMIPTAVNPSSPFRRHMELKPISQEITTEDGQRISVDINLRLISPPPGQSGNTSPSQQQLALMPVPENGPGMDQRGFGVPYQMQDSYEGYGYADDQGQYNNGYNGDGGGYNNAHLSQEELALVDPSGYSKRYQPGSVSFKDEEESNTDMKSLEEGYASLYHKMKSKDPSDHPWYKVYNMNDYKKMQREVRLNRGTLGPDLDTESYKDKMEKRHKQFEYARMVMEKNRMELSKKPPTKFPKQPERHGEQGVKRQTALDYAKKNIPKPTVKPRPNQYNSYEVAAQLGPGSPKGRVNMSKMSTPQGSTQNMDVIDIRTLEQRHIQERKNADKIRQNMDSVLTQKAH